MSSSFLKLYFTKETVYELVKTSFYSFNSGGVSTSIRGKTAGAFHGCSSFQWTPAVQAMCVLMLRCRNVIDELSRSEACILGGKGSLAASLDYSISKVPIWLLDMFGVDRNGVAIAKRLFRRTNPERKRIGPVAIAVNNNILPTAAIMFFIDDELITDSALLLEMANQIEQAYYSSTRKILQIAA